MRPIDLPPNEVRRAIDLARGGASVRALARAMGVTPAAAHGLTLWAGALAPLLAPLESDAAEPAPASPTAASTAPAVEGPSFDDRVAEALRRRLGRG
jgi:hypothetical protein